MRRRCLFIVATILALAGAGAAGQGLTPGPAPQAPPRDPTSATQAGEAAIRGRVVAADTGRPLRRARVTVTSPELGGPPRNASTDNDGRYEVTDLPAGRYRLSVRRSGYLSIEYGQRRALEQGKLLDVLDGQALEDIDFVVPRMGVIAGRVTDELGDPMEGATVAALRLRYWEGRRQLVPTGSGLSRTDDTGQYRILGLAPGTYSVRAITRETWTVSEGGVQRVMGYAPTYHPGTTAADEAQRVNVGIGQEVVNVDVPLVVGRAATISGMAFDSRGQPLATVSLRDETRGETFASFGTAGSATVSPSGDFTIRNVPPGQYRLVASTRQGVETPEAIVVPITVDGIDITGLTLIGSRGGSVTGRVLTDEGTVPNIPQLRITMAIPLTGQPDPSLLGLFRTPGSSEVAADGTFTVRGVFGPSRLRVRLPEDWMVTSIVHDGRDLTDRVIDLGGREVLSNVDIVVTNKVSAVSGRLIDDRGLPLVDATVVVFADDPELWGEDARTIRAARPDDQGWYRIRGLPAGNYLAVALEYVESGLWNDPEFLESLRRDAQRFTVSDGGEQTLVLKLVSPDRAR